MQSMRTSMLNKKQPEYRSTQNMPLGTNPVVLVLQAGYQAMDICDKHSHERKQLCDDSKKGHGCSQVA